MVGKYVHKSEGDLKGSATWGEVDSYTGGGYIEPLPHLHNSTEAHIQEFCKRLQDDGFIDGATRALFFDLVLLSPSEEHFAVVSLVGQHFGAPICVRTRFHSFHRHLNRV